jgi:hypothetical protein
MKAKQSSNRGTHTTYIELAAEVVKLVARNFKSASFSAGLIERGIRAKCRKITLTPMGGFIVLIIIMKDSKQEVRVFSIDPDSLFKLLKEEYGGSLFIHRNK